MARDTQAAFLRELERVRPQIAKAFREAIDDVQSVSQRRAIEGAIQRALRTGDIERGVREVLTALELGREFFAPLDEALRGAYVAGAQYQLSVIPQMVAPYITARFDERRPEAEAWSRDNSGRLIQGLTGEVENVVRATLSEGVANGTPFRTVKQQLIGTKTGGRTTGGLIGLNEQQAAAVRKAREELMAGDFTAYLRRAKRYKSDDRTVRRAMREGRALSEDEARRISGRYSDRLLQHRGRVIARTEGNRAMNAGRLEQTKQLIDDGKVPPIAVTKLWRTTVGKFTRDHHLTLHNTEVLWGQPFVSPRTGATMDYPHDPDAPAVDTVNCRCVLFIRIDWAYVANWHEERRAA